MRRSLRALVSLGLMLAALGIIGLIVTLSFFVGRFCYSTFGGQGALLYGLTLFLLLMYFLSYATEAPDK